MSLCTKRDATELERSCMSKKRSLEEQREEEDNVHNDEQEDEEKEQNVDRKTKALLAMSRYCQEQWVRKMMMLHMCRGEHRKLALLSGDAGCGKSYAISLLENRLQSMNVSVVVSAMTNKAAGTLMETGSLDHVFTFHKMMGFKKELLDEKLSLVEFTREYSKVYWNEIYRFQTLRGSAPPGNTKHVRTLHSCKRFTPESCAICSKKFEKLREPNKPDQQFSMEKAPPFLGANVLIVDEYGLMNLDLLERMLSCLDLFYGQEGGPLIVFSGSVSQLQPVGSKLRIWETERFEALLSSSTCLFVNRRQFEDPGYAEALTYLQFNTVTQESRRIFRSQVSVSEPQIMDPEYEPEKIRIFHQDRQQMSYTTAYMNKVKLKGRFGEKFLSVSRERSYHKGPRAWYEVLKEAAHTLPKLFSVPRYCAGKPPPKERDYLNVEKLWVGCRVRVIWHMDSNGIHLADEKQRPWRSGALADERMRLGKQQQQRRKRNTVDTEGVIKGIVFNPKNKFNEFYVEGDQTGSLYKITPSTWNYMNWTVTTHPLACLLAMNTYDCQGCTVRGQVLYHPPRYFSQSPIKPSVYVVLSRVVKRHNLKMTNCNFAEQIGTVDFYDDRLVSYRKRVEMNYSS